MHSKCWKHGNCLAEMPGVLCSVGERLCSSGGSRVSARQLPGKGTVHREAPEGAGSERSSSVSPPCHQGVLGREQ